MERRLTEERITRRLLKWLIEKGWQILSYDYPQSGTGLALHSKDRAMGSKNIGAIIPDIIAVKAGIVLFFENKVDFNIIDIEALTLLKHSGLYDLSIQELLKIIGPVEHMYFGIALKNSPKNKDKICKNEEMLDFALLVDDDLSVNKFFDRGVSIEHEDD